MGGDAVMVCREIKVIMSMQIVEGVADMIWCTVWRQLRCITMTYERRSM